jgi:hypothetical protein
MQGYGFERMAGKLRISLDWWRSRAAISQRASLDWGGNIDNEWLHEYHAQGDRRAADERVTAHSKIWSKEDRW